MVKKVGDLFNKDITRYQEGCKFNITDFGAELLIFFNNPTQEEIKGCKQGNLNFNFIKIDSVIYFITKIEGVAILDAPYSVHLSKSLTKIDYPSNENQGLSLVIYLINAYNGKIEAMRLIGLSSVFSEALIEAVKEQGNEQFDIIQYERDIQNTIKKYDAKKLSKMSKYYCNIKK